jgi:predicted CoA-binding protein
LRFANPPRADIEALLRRARTLAVVGLSADPARTSHGVSAAMQRFGYRVIPVNPAIDAALGERAVPDLARLADALRPGEQVDIVNVFRRPEHVAGIVDECVALGLPALWLQQGVVDEAAAQRARDAGIFVVMDRCIYQDRARL